MKRLMILVFALTVGVGVGSIFAQGKTELPTAFAVGIPVDARNCVADRFGDVYISNPANVVDLIQLCAGTNGSIAALKMTFTMAADVRGYIYLDTDRDGTTGKNLYGIQPAKSFGYEYTLDLNSIGSSSIVRIYSSDSGEEVGSFRARMDGSMLELPVPLSIIKSSGSMNIAAALGDGYGSAEILDVPFLSLFAVETRIYPNGGKFVQRQIMEPWTYTNVGPEVTVKTIRAFLNSRDVGLWTNISMPLSFGFYFGLLAPGKYTLTIVTETNLGTFSDEAVFEVISDEKAIPRPSEVPTVCAPLPPSVPSTTPMPGGCTPPVPTMGSRG